MLSHLLQLKKSGGGTPPESVQVNVTLPPTTASLLLLASLMSGEPRNEILSNTLKTILLVANSAYNIIITQYHNSHESLTSIFLNTSDVKRRL